MSAKLFGRGSPYYVPHNLYYDLKRAGFTPSLFQLLALSRISGYRLTDWLSVFGFAIETIPALQTEIPSRRTMLLDSSLTDSETLVPWFIGIRESLPAGTVPLSRVISWTKPIRVGTLPELHGKGSLYAKIGEQDALAFPELLAGSIVRARPATEDQFAPETDSKSPKNLALVEHSKGLCCCRVRAENGRIKLTSAQFPEVEISFKVPEEARVLGIVDLEIRRTINPQAHVLAEELAKSWKPEALSRPPSQFGPRLRHARLSLGLSFRAASRTSRQIAESLGDRRYFIAPSTLSDYETFKTPPRHFHKVITLCVAYGLSMNTTLATLPLLLGEAGNEPMPDRLRTTPERRLSAAKIESGTENVRVLGDLISEIGEVPLFLRHALPALSGLRRLSLKDFFWIGRLGRGANPYLEGASIAIVNRQKKKPNNCGSKPLWQQPLSVVLKRDGNYLCGCCSRENNGLLVHSYVGGVHAREKFRYGDAEIIGQITTVMRRV